MTPRPAPPGAKDAPAEPHRDDQHRKDPAPTPAGKPTPARAIAARAGRIAAREAAVTAEGARHSSTQLSRWWRAEDLSTQYLTAFHLNHQHRMWKKQRNTDLREINTQLKHWRGSRAADAFKQRKQYAKAATAVRTQAFTPSPPTPGDVAATQAARARNRHRGTLAVLAISTALAVQHPAPALELATGTVALATATAWIQGRRPTTLRPTAPDLAFPYRDAPGHPDTPTADTTPYPITQATTPDQAADCLARALRAENIPLAEITDVAHHPWGWQATVRLAKGTPTALIDKAPDLETLLDLGQGDVIVQPLRSRTACAILLLRQGDMFADMPPAPYLAPKSISITDPAILGASADGSQLAFALAGLMGEIIARSGGGKSTLLRALVDVTTACHDTVTMFLDPSGDGPGPYEDAIRLTSLDPATIERVLLWLHCLAAGRARIRRTLHMGDSWQPSADHPAVVVYIDEFPKLTALSKLLIASLLLVGRKELVLVFYAAQGATSAFLGSNIAQQPALKILGPCRDVDVKAALGGGRIDEGWLPHRLNPKAGDDLRDCAQVYIEGAPGMPDEPVLHKFHHIDIAEGRRRAAERLAADLIDLDPASLAAAQAAPLPDFVDLDPDDAPPTWSELLRLCGAPGAPPAAAPPAIAQHLLDAFHTYANPDALTVGQILAHLRTVDPDHWRRWDDRDETDRLREAGKSLARALRTAGLTLTSTRLPELPGKPSGYRLADLRADLQ